jgi:hypothetical protein
MDCPEPTGRRSGHGRWDQLLDACTDGLAGGLRSHIAGALGIVLNTVAICSSVLLAHILLGVPVAVSGVGAGAGTLIYIVTHALRYLCEHDAH